MASTLGVRSLREEYAKPIHRADIPRNLRAVEEWLERERFTKEPVASEERHELPRFQYLFEGGELLPPAVFMCALELGNTTSINGKTLPYDAEVLILRDQLVAAYKPLVAEIRRLHTREIDKLPQPLVIRFTRSWSAWEGAWLRNREVHAVEALQPLAKAILSLEPVLNSVKKEKLLPWPRVKHQKAVTLKCLEGFVHALSELAGSVLPSLSRELDHDPRLLLLMDHVLTLQGAQLGQCCLTGVSATPDVTFPTAVDQGPRGVADLVNPAANNGGGMPLDSYAFRLLGASVGDAVAAGKLPAANDEASRTMSSLSRSASGTAIGARTAPGTPPKSAGTAAKPTDIQRRATSHAAELLAAFESVKDVLLSLKPTLEHIDPSLDRDEVFVGHLQRFERAFKRSKKLFLEPDNLA